MVAITLWPSGVWRWTRDLFGPEYLPDFPQTEDVEGSKPVVVLFGHSPTL